jgi:hypothetical protein
VVGDGGERGLGLPGHVGVGLAAPVLEDLDHAAAGQVQVGVGVAAVRQVVAGEGVDKGAVDVLGGEDVEQLAQVGGLLVLVAGVVAVEPGRAGRGRVPLDDVVAGLIGRARVGAAAELGDRDRLAVGAQGPEVVGVAVGRLGRPVAGVGRDDVEGVQSTRSNGSDA